MTEMNNPVDKYWLIKNWDRYQHYKTRTPPWIKLHYEILHSADWLFADDTSKLLMMICLLIASRNEGRVPNRPELIQRVAGLQEVPDLAPLLASGFLQADA